MSNSNRQEIWDKFSNKKHGYTPRQGHHTNRSQSEASDRGEGGSAIG